MRIAQIVPSLELRHGGPSISVPSLARALADIGHNVELVATLPQGQTPGTFLYAGTRIFPRRLPLSLSRSPEMSAHLARRKSDVFHHHGLWLRSLHYAHTSAQRRSAPLIISPRGMMAPWGWQHRRWKKRLANAWVHPGALAGAKGWHATSEIEAHDIRALGFNQPVCVAPNGVAGPSPEMISSAAAYWHARCPEAFSRPSALFYARFHEKKRVLELIDLWLQSAPSNWLLLLVGIPETYSVEELTNQVRSANGSDRIKVFNGDGVLAPYAAASLFLLPSHSENFGLTVAEALAHGLPAVVTDTTPWQDMAAAGHGWCVPWVDFGATLKKVLQQTPEQLQQRGQAGREWVLANYSWKKSAQLLAEFYQSLLPS